MKRVLRKHSLAARWFHWLNFPLLAVMIWSGLLIYWANDVYSIGWGDKTILKFFPDSFHEALNIPYRLAEGMSQHFVFMWLFMLNGILYFIYIIISGEWKTIFPNKNSFKRGWNVFLKDIGIRKTHPTQNEKYNDAQRIAYTGVILLGILSVITGFAIYKPEQLGWLCNLLGGYAMARAEHFIITVLFTLFFVIHLIQVARSGWKNFSSMITGFIVKEPLDKNAGNGE